jgi:hypothetical protein
MLSADVLAIMSPIHGYAKAKVMRNWIIYIHAKEYFHPPTCQKSSYLGNLKGFARFFQRMIVLSEFSVSKVSYSLLPKRSTEA